MRRAAADRDPRVLGLVPGQLDVLLAPLLGQLRQRHPDDVAVVGRVDAEIGVADRLLDRGHRGLVVRGDQHHPGVRHLEAGELLQRGRRAVVVGGQLGEHRRVGPTGADRRELLLGVLDRQSILSSASLMMSEITGSAPQHGSVQDDLQQCVDPPAGGIRRGRSYRSSHPRRPDDGAVGVQAEEDHRQLVVPGHADRGRVGDLEVAGQVLVVAAARRT